MLSATLLLSVAMLIEMQSWAWLASRQPLTLRSEAVRQLKSSSVEIVVVGSSHIYTGVNPARMPALAVNLADSSLNYQVAELLINEYWDHLKSAKLVVLELDAVPLYSDTIKLRNGDLRDFWNWGLSSSDLPMGWWNRVAGTVTERFASTRFGSCWNVFLHSKSQVETGEVIGRGSTDVMFVSTHPRKRRSLPNWA